MKWTSPALFGTAALLWSCGGPASPGPSPSAGSSSTLVTTPQTVVSGLSSSVGLQGTRSIEKSTITKYSWTLTKKALPTEQLSTTQAKVSFQITATRTEQSSSGATTKGTVLSTPAGAPLSVCNDFGSDMALVKNDFRLLMHLYGPQGELQGSPVDVTASAALVDGTVVPGGLCRQWNLTMSSQDYPAFDAADEFMLSFATTATSNGNVYATNAESPRIRPTETVKTTTTEVGDKSVNLSDPDMNFFQTIDGTFSQTLSRVLTCADTAQLVVNPAVAYGYRFNNTAYLGGASTDLSASDTANLTLKCSQGCTYTQGYYKTHGILFHGVTNKKYDAAAWKAAPLTIGNVSYSQLRLLEIYNMPVQTNQAIALFHQLATALLNLGKDPPADAPNGVKTTITSAQTFFSKNQAWLTTPTAVPSDWITTLDNFNNGRYTQHCD